MIPFEPRPAASSAHASSKQVRRAGGGGDQKARHICAPCSFGLSATSQQYFSLRTNQSPTISQQYFSQNKSALATSLEPS
jgi:hypothetical protein